MIVDIPDEVDIKVHVATWLYTKADLCLVGQEGEIIREIAGLTHGEAKATDKQLALMLGMIRELTLYAQTTWQKHMGIAQMVTMLNTYRN